MVGAPLIAGVDEAGRGPVFGPLIVACAVSADPDGLKELGVRDSKKLTPKARERLAPLIRERLEGHAVVAVEPRDIDRLRGTLSLNRIESDAFVEAVVRASSAVAGRKPELLQADAADANASAFARRLREGLAKQSPPLSMRVVAEHKADARFPVVSAASVLAKVERDRRLEELRAEFGAGIGSGYPSDDTTIRFLREYITANRDLPPFARRSWKPAQRMLNEAGALNKPLDRFSHEVDLR